jgi:ribosomal protein L37AE/L43A
MDKMKQSKKQIVLLLLGLVVDLILIIELFFRTQMFSFIYPIINQNEVIIILVIVGTSLLTIYFISVLLNRQSKPASFYSRELRKKPSFANPSNQEKREAYGLKWIVYKPDAAARLAGINLKPWADGPYCPTCEQELKNKVRGKVRKNEVWYCSRCEKDYEKPNRDVKDMVEKEFEAELRRRGEL